MTDTANDIVVVTGLVKRFGEHAAVDGVDFQIRTGEIFGLLGPNGAGKTTAISVISCLLAPTEGTVRVDGALTTKAAATVKRALGVVPQEIALYPTLTALENLKFWGRMYGLSGALLEERVAEALELAGLADRAKERVETYSGGMKRRINIAAGIMHHPKVLIMDEPTVGIDPQSRNHILETVKELNHRGMTVLYTSHYMEEVEFLCDRVAIMDHGRIIAQGTIDELKRLVGGENVISVRVHDVPEGALESLRALEGVDSATASASEATSEGAVEGGGEGPSGEAIIQVLSHDSGLVIADVVGVLGRAGAKVLSVDVREPNLESVFLHLTGKSLRD
jgi:ABC-2 type transport system ATP-binding protein